MAKYFVINIYAIINFQNFYYLYEFYHNFLKLYLTLKLTYTTKEKKNQYTTTVDNVLCTIFYG